MEDDDPDDLYGLQGVAEDSEDRPPLEVVDLTAESEDPTDQAEEAPAPENMEPLPIRISKVDTVLFTYLPYFLLFCLIPCHLGAPKMSKSGLGLYNVHKL